MSWRSVGFMMLATGISLSAQAVVAAESSGPMDQQARKFIQQYLDEVRPVEIRVNQAWWEANTSGRNEDFARKEQVENELNGLLSDKTTFARLKALHEGELADALLHRQIDVLYLQYLGKQVSSDLLRRMTAKANQIEQAFNLFRAEVGDEELTDSEVRKTLSTSTDSAVRREVWEASKAVGKSVEADLRELVALRNQAAQQLGFSDYHTLQLRLNEQDPAEVMALFDQLDQLTREPFRQAKAEIDRRLAERYAITVDQLRPLALPRSVFPRATQGV